ncbi:hypothetical protein CKA54_05130 [Campylobacter sp. P255]|uniref:autotransporter outer membrane beta-barrel domain-containing protein n=1 Tax=Campylobacter sp. P255 TaxID=1979368 RepID=UPI000EA86AFD|nr:autotransporter outer membrane beta-barrel domain-containing protein [Campylobacter sp. P255]RKO64414.1 hypothetical protein CKA54_05130 [Campylobacter sp. P255]
MATISDQNSNGSIEITKTKKIKNISNCDSKNKDCTINNEKNGQITISGTDNGTLTVTESGKIETSSGQGIMVNNSATITAIDNKGTMISSSENGVFVQGQNSKIETLNNKGVIKGKVSGVKVDAGSIGTITNSGTIQGENYYGMYINVGATVDNIDNTGTIIGNKSGIVVSDGAKVSSIVNKGTIIANKPVTGPFINNSGSGIYVYGANSQVKTINNEGLILTSNTGISVAGRADNGKNVETIKNSKTIKYTGSVDMITKENEGLGQGAGIYMGNIEGIPKIGTVDNSGLIDTYNGMYFSLGTQVQTINNSGTIIAIKDGIALGNDKYSYEELQTRIDNINNSGTIQAGRYGIFIDIANNPKVPFQIGKINIGGLVHGGIAGFYIGANQKLTEDITVSGTLTGGTAGIINNGVIGDSSDPSKGGIKLKGGGLISASNNMLSDDIINPAILNTGNGVIYGNTELDGKSKIVGGIVNSGNGRLQGDIIVKGGSSISGGIINTGSGVVTGSIKIEGSDSAIEGGIINDGEGKLEGSIEVSDGGKLDNIINQGNGQISGNVNVSSGSSVGNITNSGNGTIGGNIKNDGNLGSINNSGSISGSIENNNGDLEIKNDGNLGGAITVGSSGGNTSISNGSSGSIGGGIVNNSNSGIHINNQGSVKPDSNGNHITNNGSGAVVVDDWVVKPNEDGSFDGVISVGGSGSGSTSIDKVTVDISDSNYDASKPINPDSIVSDNTTHNGGSGGVSKPSNVGTNSDLLSLFYDPISGTYKTLADVSAGVGSVMAQTLINTYMMRSFFIDTVMDDASRVAYKHARVHEHKKNKDLVGFSADEHYQGFVLPYFSSNSIKLLGTSDYSKGHTKGIIAGFHTLRDIGMLGVYLGTEEANMDTKDYFSLKMQTIYAGLKYSNLVLEDEIKEAFIKAYTKVAYTKNDVQKFIDKGKREANGNTDTYGYGASIGTGMNFYLNGVDSVITPEVSLNYEGGFTKAFSMTGDGALNHERYYKSELNLFSSTASIKWFNQWHPQISTSLEAGARINFNPEVNSRVNFASLKASETLKLPRTYQYAGASLIFSLAKDLDMSFNYNGIFAENAYSHTGYLQFDFKF